MATGRGRAMIQEDRELLAELGRLNSDVVPLAMQIMDERVMATAQEQYAFAKRLIAIGRRLQARAARSGLVVEAALLKQLLRQISATGAC